MLFLFRFAIILIILFSKLIYANNILINKPLSTLDTRYQYTYDLLSLIMSVTPEFGDDKIEQSSTYMTRNRTLHELISGEFIDVMAEAPQPEWDEKLIVVPIPIRKGLQGFRLFIVNEESAKLMNEVNKFEDLLALSTGSGKDWSTKRVLERAGFNVVTGSNYNGLFGMLSKNRFSTFARGINEVYEEVASRKSTLPNLMVDKNVLLYIPLATYFYISPKKPLIAERIKVGLLRLIKSGAFNIFFYNNHCKSLMKAQISKRKVFNIPNEFIATERMLSLVNADFLVNTDLNFNQLCH
ncbi:hypothetical protein [Colwellia hornerae]|uniref:Amino acid ABC transporter substrate-binding protein n=1 Tax=Colwellia hornerae TaxID=89402 RepID=A0A5C6QMP6_9GAMM|nr:hypothetical protein [Colwellia hornerae]TWX53647.1 hypothetical protein ESZ28_09190 [Colwellia hornerae]TWX60298.1 hypothetical protein ESZ26_07965 [Colwellia hornerae]TWX70053.1 hypothetical protein ESZ27_04655 [Colwellia hornerae]